jgi:hypothetical protein
VPSDWPLPGSAADDLQFLQSGITAVMFSDGLIHAGSGTANRWISFQPGLSAGKKTFTSDDMSDLLEHALKLDQGRPADDISVVVLRVTGAVERSADDGKSADRIMGKRRGRYRGPCAWQVLDRRPERTVSGRHIAQGIPSSPICGSV